jgi:hypothetical protein
MRGLFAERSSFECPENEMNRRQFVCVAGGLALSARGKALSCSTANHVVMVGAGIMGASIG